MQKREFKNAMIEMSDNVSRRIRDYSDEITLNYRTKEGKVLEGTDLNGAQTVLYVILNKLLKEFEPKNENYAKTEKELCEFFDISYEREINAEKEKELS
tara:strand:+ start:119 stop:415 length:297 start_codon:yes stop_codon:yes gene_type:complete